jgi:hypothetical protein
MGSRFASQNWWTRTISWSRSKGLVNCRSVAADGAVGAGVAPDFDFAGYRLVPGVLHAYKASPADLSGLVRAP